MVRVDNGALATSVEFRQGVAMVAHVVVGRFRCEAVEARCCGGSVGLAQSWRRSIMIDPPISGVRQRGRWLDFITTSC